MMFTNSPLVPVASGLFETEFFGVREKDKLALKNYFNMSRFIL